MIAPCSACSFQSRLFAALLAAALLPFCALASASLAHAAATSAPAATTFKEARKAYVQRIDAHPPSGNIDKDFSGFLQPQHRSGVELARVELAHGHNSVLRTIAEGIVAHADRDRPVTTSAAPLDSAQRQAVNARLAKADSAARAAFSQPPAGTLDAQFARLMDAHHQRAIAYAETEVHYGRDQSLIALANHILDGQRHEHRQMQRIQQDTAPSQH
ncbi:hypothetical protein R84981_000337 [Carnimonas sp. R-84981]|uniref:DUF305 domain-containing protein n=1 Tax=Carnimonas bestiolae TaxID=3402172 RepID=UPI003EDC68B5